MISLFRDYYTLRTIRDNWEDFWSNYHRNNHWNYVKLRDFFIKIKLHRRRCSECSKIISCYGYKGVYDMCNDCFDKAHPY